MDYLSDEYLMAQAMLGTRSSLETLVERYHAPLLGYLYRLTDGNRPLAEDLVQETFIRLLRQDSYQTGRPFKPWLYSIATHLAYDHFKSSSARRIIHADEQVQSKWVDPAPGPEEQIQGDNRAEGITTALNQLGEEYRVTLLLRFYEGLSLKEIADVLQIPLGTVKSRLSVGTMRLRGLLVRFERGE